mgnify:CR=1 FL=1
MDRLSGIVLEQYVFYMEALEYIVVVKKNSKTGK